MKVLVIGGTGVISRAVVDKLLNHNHEVSIFNRGNNPLNFNNKVEQIIGDRKNQQAFKAIFSSRKFDVVMDMISFNESDAKLTIETFKNNVNQFIFTSSTAAYRKPFNHFPVVEESEILTTDKRFMYGFLKAEMERYLNQEIKINHLNVTIIRPSLTYGIGSQNIGILRQNYGIIDRIKKGKPLVMFGDGSTPWSFTFSPDLAKGYVGLVGNEKSYGEAYHITNEDHHIWEDLYLEFGKIIGVEPKIVHIPSELLIKADQNMFSHLYYEKTYGGIFDNSKIKRVVPNFKASISLNEGLTSIANWFENEANNVDQEKDQFEDKLVELFNQWSNDLSRIKED